MESLLLDSSGDLVMINGELQFVRGIDEVVQVFRTLMKTNLNEWFLNPLQGFDYAVINGVKTIEYESLDLALQNAANQIDEIDRVEDIEIVTNREERSAIIKGVAYLVNGESFPFEEVF